MFSKDNRHYRATPRTLQDAFGPYHVFHEQHRRAKSNIVCAALGVIALGVIYGLLFGWRG